MNHTSLRLSTMSERAGIGVIFKLRPTCSSCPCGVATNTHWRIGRSSLVLHAQPNRNCNPIKRTGERGHSIKSAQNMNQALKKSATKGEVLLEKGYVEPHIKRDFGLLEI